MTYSHALSLLLPSIQRHGLAFSESQTFNTGQGITTGIRVVIDAEWILSVQTDPRICNTSLVELALFENDSFTNEFDYDGDIKRFDTVFEFEEELQRLVDGIKKKF